MDNLKRHIIGSTMEVDDAFRRAILGLLARYKQCHVRALTLNTTLATIMQLPPSQRAELRPVDIEVEVQKARSRATERVNELSAGLERALLA